VRIDDYLKHAAASARQVKERACRNRPADIQPYVCAYRGNDPIAMVTLQHHIRDEILNVALQSAAGFDADVLCLAFETYAAVSLGDVDDTALNPRTGKEWGPGEMQELAEKYGGLEKGWVSEAVSVTVVNRAGDVAMLSQMYRYSGRHLVWTDLMPNRAEPSDDGETKVFGGVMADALRQIMLSASGSQLLPDSALDRTEKDIATVFAIGTMTECAPLLFADSNDDPRIRTLRKVRGVTEL
jgi:hypothetical protein